MKDQDRDATIFFYDILDSIHRIERFTKGMEYEDFLQDEKNRYATIPCIESIGEAAKHIPTHLRSRYPAIPWNDSAGMRDKIIHACFSIDPLKSGK